MEATINQTTFGLGRNREGSFTLQITENHSHWSLVCGNIPAEKINMNGLEPGAITSLLAKLGTADPVVPVLSLQTLAQEFDFARVGRAPARFDSQELEALNAKLLHETPYSDVAPRLEAFGANEAIWNAISGNVTRLADVQNWMNVIAGEIDPVIEDATMLDEASNLVPDQLDENSWSSFTNAIKERTGAKGKKLFMPLRLALTGQARGPEMAVMLPLIGATKARARLKGERA